MVKREELKKVYDKGFEAVYDLYSELDARLNALERLINTNSRNSSKPPSSDGPGRPNPKSLREKSGKKPGGQPGHNGSTLKKSKEPTQKIILPIPESCECGFDLLTITAMFVDSRQVFDIPKIAMQVLEYIRTMKKCPFCGKVHQAQYPEAVKQPVQYGENVSALAVYMQSQQLLPVQRTAEFIETLSGHRIGAGTLVSMQRRFSNALIEHVQTTREKLLASPVAHCDETSVYVDSATTWLHNFSNRLWTLYHIDAKRGTIGIENMGMLPLYTGTALHDGWAAYFQYDCRHGLCNAHHLRELTFAHEEECRRWAKHMKELLQTIKKAVDRAKKHGKSSLSTFLLRKYDARYDQIIKNALRCYDPPKRDPGKRRGRIKQEKSKNLLDRLKKNKDAALLYMHDFNVPFDNNQAERDVRMMKVKQKISGCYRSLNGARVFVCIRGFISTIKKQQMDIMNSIIAVHNGTFQFAYA